jgi:4-hydroxy-2-oxoglutarate aldolase
MEKRQPTSARLRGILSPVVTPFDRRGEIDKRGFRQNLGRYAGSGLAGIVVAGSTGEAPYLTERERLRLTEIARDVVRPPNLLMVGTGLESTRETLRLSREAVRAGADVILLLTPNYYKARMDGAAMLRHFRALADALTKPVVMYNIPQFTGIKMSPETIGRLSRHPNIIGLKESSGDLPYVKEILRTVRPGFRVLIGAPAIFLDGLRAGAAGGVLGPSTFAPEICVALYEASLRRQWNLARDLQRRLTLLVQRIGGPFGVAGIKAANEVRGFVAGPPRSPLAPLGRADRAAIAAALREARDGLEV